ncbi:MULTISPECIES: ATP-dependent nuclease [unclassified Rathayibacter]|uniref:ATP-dependent nuclease n=1 Tax=unclassified Rathayibacter TaxID=2609250 RepID=UPI00138ED328|nr:MULTISPECIES: AAA family ATPase [unclassified Rathayibacter]
MATNWEQELAAAVGAQNPEWLSGDSEKFKFALNRIRLKNGQHIDIHPSGVTAIVGSNNAGKSTILRELVELLSHQPGYSMPKRLVVDGLDLVKAGEARDLVSWLGKNASFLRPSTGNSMVGFQRSTSGQASIFGLTQGWVASPDELGQLSSFLCFYGNAQGRFAVGGAIEMRDAPGDPPTHPVHHLQDNKEMLNELSRISEKSFRSPLTLDPLGRTVRLRTGSIAAETPRIDEISESYREAMIALRPLDEQGDGMRSMFGQLLPVVTATYPLILLDEPEAFLHPPQAHALGVELGHLAVARKIQIIVATHDRNLLSGLLESQVDVSVVRLSRKQESTYASQLEASQLRNLWADSVLRYTNVLDGLFHQLVILAEAEGDCAFLAAALDSSPDKLLGDLPRSEVLFLPTGGKDGIPKVAEALQAVQVPMVAAPDLDVLSDKAKCAILVRSLGSTWTERMDQLWDQATNNIRTKKEPATIGDVLDALSSLLGESRTEPFTSDVAERARAQLRSSASPWAEVKDHGVSAFKGEAYTAAVALLELLETVGVVLVREGELERLAPEVAVRKGAGWLQAALDRGAQSNQLTQGHLARIIEAGKLARNRSIPVDNG